MDANLTQVGGDKMSRLPKSAKKVFTGVLFDVYQWQQELFDGSYVTYESIVRVDTVQVIAVNKDHVIVADEEQSGLKKVRTLFGGKSDKGEEPLAAAKRELLEESGLVSDDWELLMVSVGWGKILWDVYYYIARNCKKNSEPRLEAGEKVVSVDLTFDEFIDLVTRDYWDAKFANIVLKMKLEPAKLEEFKAKLFGN